MKLGVALRTVVAGGRLTAEEARAVFAEALGPEPDPVQLGGLLVALAQRGEAREELVGAARSLRDAALPFEHDAEDAIDTCGTGGDGLSTFNVSTAAAIVAAAAGARVVKHGNRAQSSRCGSADLVEALGVPLELAPPAAREVLDEAGITFLFAPLYHPALRAAAPVRRSLGLRTLFNLLGPLCNPGRVRRQLVGTAERARVGELAEVLAELGCERGYVVHGAGGADELALDGPNEVAPVGSAPGARFDARELGLTPAGIASLAGGDAARNAHLLGRVLAGEGGPIADAVLLNAGAALVVAARARSAEEGVALAREAVASGAARSALERWVASARRRARAGGAA